MSRVITHYILISDMGLRKAGRRPGERHYTPKEGQLDAAVDSIDIRKSPIHVITHVADKSQPHKPTEPSQIIIVEGDDMQFKAGFPGELFSTVQELRCRGIEEMVIPLEHLRNIRFVADTAQQMGFKRGRATIAQRSEDVLILNAAKFDEYARQHGKEYSGSA